MWVRNQDEHVISKEVKTIVLEDNGLRIVSPLENNILILAEYSTKEKALKVMDMLTKHINNSNNYWERYEYPEGITHRIVTQEQKVFQFPKDEEVVV